MLLASRPGAAVCRTATKHAICNVLAHAAALEANAHLKDWRRNAKVWLRDSIPNTFKSPLINDPIFCI
ncbi:hypothetical protein TWF225_011445 [Orbilia oligospora]|uniref:Uncharacterized protein n=1 Tax=Orbilia oligospora TaxID=2813651 RepID=A0A7C8PKR1_ORBOL|nr:hypothetical protein TWF225_011445 [Orbilia oligospora]KAF3170848.1 hypothetical protein TWF751_006674 [Orbilia oligospora]KAF3246760.1 hypothetical protein TWF128_008876 [Orbilia oligospora]KAF3257881.1 hypothetical protein TWF217_005984 [Orbilia oligospora]KAF3281458.1 hypothetical protein TWF132_011226 [Orbilia oligospora]